MKAKKKLTSLLISLSFTNLPSTVEIACTDTEEKRENNDNFVSFKHRREKRENNDNFVFFMQEKLGWTT